MALRFASRRLLRPGLAAERWLSASAGSSLGVPSHETPLRTGEISESAKISIAAKQERWRKIDEAFVSGLRVVVDMSYAKRMSVKERKSLGRQLSQSWAANRRAHTPVQMHFAGLGSCPSECLPKGGYETLGSWKVHRHDCGVGEAFSAAELIFLSPDADEVLTAPLDPNRVYVIGGFVDACIQRRASLQKAQELGARAVRLPLQEQAPAGVSNPRLPMSVNAVFEVLLALNAGKSWGVALGSALPLRHQVASHQAGRKARRAERQRLTMEQASLQARDRSGCDTGRACHVPLVCQGPTRSGRRPA